MLVYKTGARVSQGTYGLGTVIESNARHTVIDFDDHGVRRFVTTMVVLEKGAGPAPPRPVKSRSRRTR